MDKCIYGADSETLHGKPMTLQFYSEDAPCDQIYFVSERTAANTFIEWCARRKRKMQHVIYVHNLAFDLIEFLWGLHPKLASGAGDFEFKVGKARVSGVYGSPTFCRVQFAHGVSILLVDSFSYYRGSLAKGAELFCPELPKLRRPGGLGEKKFTRRDTHFCEYAMRDAVVTYHMGCAIEKLHREYDLMQCVSVADMAARIFRHRFLTYTIPQPERDVIEHALMSYHGGKNNTTAEAGWYENVAALDISSAYPHAMHEFPAFSNEALYRSFRMKRGTRQIGVPPHGVYCVSGGLADCKWPVIFSHSFKPLHGKIDRVWVQGHELNEALRSGELKPSRIVGHFYDAERDNQAPALRGFVDDFYAKKECEKDAVLRYMQKLILNSISGKFIQTRKRGSCAYTDIDSNTTTTAADLVAGGMFHPFIASDITAHTRARIHRLEHRYKALHTATDGIFTREPVVSKTGARNFDLCPGSKGLGALTIEATKATLLLLRNKTYVLYGARTKKSTPSRVFKGKHILKNALHGFQGKVWDLERLAASGRRTYTVTRANRLKESLKRGLVPNDFVKRQFTLKIGALTVQKKDRTPR
jgi:hypothetical protein